MELGLILSTGSLLFAAMLQAQPQDQIIPVAQEGLVCTACDYEEAKMLALQHGLPKTSCKSTQNGPELCQSAPRHYVIINRSNRQMFPFVLTQMQQDVPRAAVVYQVDDRLLPAATVARLHSGMDLYQQFQQQQIDVLTSVLTEHQMQWQHLGPETVTTAEACANNPKAKVLYAMVDEQLPPQMAQVLKSGIAKNAAISAPLHTVQGDIAYTVTMDGVNLSAANGQAAISQATGFRLKWQDPSVQVAYHQYIECDAQHCHTIDTDISEASASTRPREESQQSSNSARLMWSVALEPRSNHVDVRLNEDDSYIDGKSMRHMLSAPEKLDRCLMQVMQSQPKSSEFTAASR